MFGILLFFSWLFFSQLPAPAVQALRATCPRTRNLCYSAALGEGMKAAESTRPPPRAAGTQGSGAEAIAVAPYQMFSFTERACV